MKKIIFLLLLPISVFANDWDSIPRLMVKVSPPAFITDNVEFGGVIEYKFCKRKSFEIGGGYIVPHQLDALKIGYTVQFAEKFYRESGFYLRPSIFFRYEKFTNRNYQWNTQDSLPDGTLETSSLFGSGGSDDDKQRVANERKFVYGAQFLVGNEQLLFNLIPIDIYCGWGLRLKHRELDILDDYSRGTLHFDATYNPPRRLIINDVFPTFQFGIRIGLAFKLKKNH